MPQTKQVKKIVYAYRPECNISIARAIGTVDRTDRAKPFSPQAITQSSFGYVKNGDLGRARTVARRRTRRVLTILPQMERGSATFSKELIGQMPLQAQKNASQQIDEPINYNKLIVQRWQFVLVQVVSHRRCHRS